MERAAGAGHGGKERATWIEEKGQTEAEQSEGPIYRKKGLDTFISKQKTWHMPGYGME